MTVRSHFHSRALRRRFIGIFLGTFVLLFSGLNYRFVFANVRFWLAPGTISLEDSIGEALKLFPLAKDVSAKPLPNQGELIIDSIGVRAPIVFNIPADNKAIYQNLENGVVHYSNTAKPGAGKTVSVLLGHSSAYPWYKGHYGSVFALLGKLKVGDRFYVQYEDGRIFVYSVKRSFIFSPFGSQEELNALEQNSTGSLVLISCYPVGTNYRRIAVEADIVQQP
jgi:LPXTG-site transpeptidase (sortase) family protein